MRIKKLALFCACIVSSFPMFAYADINITNNTDSYATASIGSSPCSSSEGNGGIVKPHSTFTVPQYVFTLYCGFSTSCGGHVYMTKDCGNSGGEAAQITVDAVKGELTGYTNLDPTHYSFSGGGKSVTINPVSNGLKNWLHFLF